MNTFNPSVEEFKAANPNQTMISFGWSLFWRLYLAIFAIGFAVGFIGSLYGNS